MHSHDAACEELRFLPAADGDYEAPREHRAAAQSHTNSSHPFFLWLQSEICCQHLIPLLMLSANPNANDSGDQPDELESLVSFRFLRLIVV